MFAKSGVLTDSSLEKYTYVVTLGSDLESMGILEEVFEGCREAGGAENPNIRSQCLNGPDELQ